MDDDQRPAVLLVGPPADDRAMYAFYLRQHGVIPIVADDPDAALAQAANVAVIVTDLRVRAAADGLRLIELLRNSPKTRATPILVLTAQAFASDRAGALAAGCSAFLPKPCSPDLLLMEIRRLAAESRVHTAGSASDLPTRSSTLALQMPQMRTIVAGIRTAHSPSGYWRWEMIGGLIRALVLVVVLVAAAMFLLGWWGSDRLRSGSAPRDAVGTTGTERAREVGADIGEKTAAAADQARRGLNNAGITTKIKAKMALDDSIKALDINVDTSGSTVTVTGTVPSEAHKERVLRLARETDGVTQVVDRLQVRR